jgi:hypothetical protein
VPGPGKSQWVTDAIDLKVNAACAKCNNGWIEALEIAAEKAFLTNAALGYSVKLNTMLEKTNVGRWCGLVSTLMDQTLRPPTLPPRVHQALYAGNTPADMQAWLFRTEPPDDIDAVC